MLVKKNKKGVDDLLEIDDLREELAGMRTQYTIGSIGTLIETLQDTLEKLTETEAKKVFYDKDLGKNISDVLTKVISALNKDKTDLAPLVNVIAKQNELIQAMLSKKPENNDEKYQALLKTVLGMVEKNNSFLQSLAIPKPEVQQSVEPRPAKWEFVSTKDKFGNIKTTAEAKI